GMSINQVVGAGHSSSKKFARKTLTGIDSCSTGVKKASSLNGIRGSTLSFVCSGPTRLASPASGCLTKLIQFIGFQVCRGHEVLLLTVAFISGMTADRTSIR